METHKKLKELRLHADLSMEEMGGIVNVTGAAYRKIEHGFSIPDDHKLRVFAKHFNISVESLINEEYTVVIKTPVNGKHQIYFSKNYIADIHPALLECIQNIEQEFKVLKAMIGIV